MFDFNKILFLDIETVAQYKSIGDIPHSLLPLWNKKVAQFKQRDPIRFTDIDTDEVIYRREAGIFAEFGKIVCISVGVFHQKDGQIYFRTHSYANEDERTLLNEFVAMLHKYMDEPTKKICGHNIKEFDIPYICRRLLINGIPLPASLNMSGRKPWEVQHLVDTMELWKFGDIKNYTSLNLLTTIFGIPSPKDDIDGSQVATVYYESGDLNRISEYCQKDVLAVARLLACYEGRTPIEDEFVETT